MTWLRFFIIVLCLAPVSVQAELQLSGSFTQGGLLFGRATPGSRVYYGDRQIKLTVDGQFILGFGREAAPMQGLTLIAPDGQVTTREIEISQRSYQVQRIDGISKKMMQPNKEDLQRIRSEAQQAGQARRVDSDMSHFQEAFIWPVIGRISGVYGSQRILNGEPRRPHFGVDIAAPTGTLVKAPAGGRVTLAHKGMFFSGATLIIDHGHGLSSSFLHLNTIRVKKGQRVKKGDIIATVGATGRVTGPHLDWRINWFKERLDPALLVPEMPGN